MHFLVSLLSTPAILLAVVSFIGLCAQHKHPTEIFTGTAKTAIGFLIFGVGAATMTGALQNFNTMFTKGFHLVGVIASPEAATAQIRFYRFDDAHLRICHEPSVCQNYTF